MKIAYQFDESAGSLPFLTERVFLAHPQDHCCQQPRSAFSLSVHYYGGQSGPSFLLPELWFSFGQDVGWGES